ncbi:MAG TPA: hypothetical protein VG963_14170, partial [Polyangiaceae bacterium]|nr:hypothetical protein [Polyangiaceae bacterium]
GDGGTNPAAGIQGSAHATRTASGGLQVVLTVSGLPASRAFGAHVHKLSCDDMMAGGHYENDPAPPDASTSDPTYANPANEVWLDFTTDSTGAATAETTETWIPRAGQAKAIVVHDHHTGDGGAAGQKLACLNIAF